MKLYRYNALRRVPAPILNIKLRNPITGRELQKLGKIDSGADLSVIPLDTVEELKLEQRGTERVGAYDRHLPPKEVPAYYVDAEIADFLFRRTRVIEALRGDVLIGRNVINKLRVVLDGKKLLFEISDPL